MVCFLPQPFTEHTDFLPHSFTVCEGIKQFWHSLCFVTNSSLSWGDIRLNGSQCHRRFLTLHKTHGGSGRIYVLLVDRHASEHPLPASAPVGKRRSVAWAVWPAEFNKQRVLMHGHQGWNIRHGLCHIYMIYVYIWVVHSFCLFCCLFIIVTTQFVALYEPCKPKPKPKPKPSTYDTRTTTPWQRSKFRYLDRSQSNKYAINMQIQTISVSK